MHNLTKATSIPGNVKSVVWRRDGCRCVICGSINAGPHCHYIRRSQLGMGVEENIWTGCDECHRKFDSESTDGDMHQYIENYLKSWYPNWKKENLIYKKYGGKF